MRRRSLGLGAAVALDIVLINVAFLLSYFVRYQLEIPYAVDPAYDAPFTPYIPYAVLLTFLCLFAYWLSGLYDPRRSFRWFDEVYRIFSGTTSSIIIVMAITFFIRPLVYSRGMLLLAGFLILALLGVIRIGDRLLRAYLRRRGIGVQKALIVGAGEVGRAVMRTILADSGLGYQVVGYVDDDPAKGNTDLGRFKGFGGLDNVPRVAEDEKIDEVIITLPWMYHRKIVQIVDDCERRNIRVRVVPDVFQQRMQHVDIESLNGIPLIGVERKTLSAGALFVKRLVEIALIVVTLPVLALVFGIVAIVIKLDSPGPILFKHRRIGRDGIEFDMYKFRSMVVNAEELRDTVKNLNEADGPLFKIKNDPRTTRVGWFLRRMSIDEIPQLINVARGEMSIVGPRPGTAEEVAQYQPWQLARLGTKPGLTGLWQVSGRSDLPFDEMCLLDIYYIENWSLGLDIRIMLQTIPLMLFGRGAY
jgi:exopolysaccharide biosynthesis polyprenyl glycosylphosphotransferase